MRQNQLQEAMSNTHSCPSRRFQEGEDQEEGCRAGQAMPPHAQPPAPEPLSATAETLSNGDKFNRSGNVTQWHHSIANGVHITFKGIVHPNVLSSCCFKPCFLPSLFSFFLTMKGDAVELQRIIIKHHKCINNSSLNTVRKICKNCTFKSTTAKG